MAPTPKRRHSTRRTGKRRASKKLALPSIVYDKKTGQPRLPHRNRPELVASSQPNASTQKQDKPVK